MPKTTTMGTRGRNAPGEELLAKSPAQRNGAGRTLIGHTEDVIEAFKALFGTLEQPTDLTDCWARFFGLADRDAFLRNGLVAAACHDWGKANDGFQAMLRKRGKQLLRHEQISAVLMTQPSIWDWLSRSPELDVPLILSAVAGHHLKARDIEFGQPQSEIDTLLRVRWDDPKFQRGIVSITTNLDVPGFNPPGAEVWNIPKLWSFDFEHVAGVSDLGEALDKVKDELETLGGALEQETDEARARRRMLWAVRAGLIAADSAGSGLYREGESVSGWIQGAFEPRDRLDEQAIERKIIGPRLKKIDPDWSLERGIADWTGWNDFQKACADPEKVPARALLLAPCGSGKTLAAWRWIAARCAERPRGRVIFLYPTRGTATEGYRDYVSYAGPEEAALVHGSAEFDLDGIHPDLDVERRIAEARLFSLRQWTKRIFSATVDQFLGFLQHGYGPTCLLPLLADSVIVFDEIHSYDRGMFSALEQFLEHFDVPVLCMTATLLEWRQERLKKGGELGDRGLEIVKGLEVGREGSRLKTIADYPRYQVRIVPDAGAAEDQVKEALHAGQRVLWVVNTVDRAQQIARRLAADPKAKRLRTKCENACLFCYHSRFRLVDRKKWHNRVIKSFRRRSDRRPPRAVLAVTTQVCEMSLDLDADVLVTEFAPVSSLVQRMGRCCRDPDADLHRPVRTGQVVLYRPEDEAPYTKKDMLGVEDFIDKLEKEGVVSQSQLEGLLAGAPQAAELPKECRFIFSGPWAASGEENFRDIDQYARQALLPGDVEEYLHLQDSKKSWQSQALILSVPKNFIDTEPDKKLPSWLRLTKGGCYRPPLGYGERDEPPGPRFA